MAESVPFGGSDWWWVLASLLLGRGSDLFSTWVATPSLMLEANPVARWLGWKWALPLNLVICLGFAFFPLPAVIIATTSMLVAARNFQQAWLMRTLGEEAYRVWHIRRLQETPMGLFCGCLGMQSLLTAAIGGALAWSSVVRNHISLLPFGIGVGIMTYAVSVTFYTLLAVWRVRRSIDVGE